VAYCHAAYTVGLALNGILFLSSSRCIGGAFVAFFLFSQVYIQNLGFDMLCLLPFHDARNYQGHPIVRGVTLVSNILSYESSSTTPLLLQIDLGDTVLSSSLTIVNMVSLAYQ
jgi:hypothetical protein